MTRAVNKRLGAEERKKSPPSQSGVAARINDFEKCAQTGWLVMTAKPTTDARAAHRFELEIKQGALRGHQRMLRNLSNHPACAFKGVGGIFLMAQAPRLAKAGTPLFSASALETLQVRSTR